MASRAEDVRRRLEGVALERHPPVLVDGRVGFDPHVGFGVGRRALRGVGGQLLYPYRGRRSSRCFLLLVRLPQDVADDVVKDVVEYRVRLRGAQEGIRKSATLH